MKFKLIIFLSLIVLGGLGWWSLRDGKTKIIFCDVGQGDGILIAQKNKQILFDTGPDNKRILECLERQMPFWDKTLEAVIVTHNDSDHSGGMADVIKSYKINNLFSDDRLDTIIEQKISSKKLYANDILKVGLINYEVVNPDKNDKNLTDKNDSSIAGILSYKDKRILLLADISGEVERKLVWRKILNQKVDVLKVSHHGSGTATSDELLKTVKPKTAVISVGKNNLFDHPQKEVLKRLMDYKIDIRRTDEEGEIIFNLD